VADSAAVRRAGSKKIKWLSVPAILKYREGRNVSKCEQSVMQ
jgi:hypothetical protein